MMFKDLAIGEVFRFDRAGVPFGESLAQGPWVKVSARCYVLRLNHGKPWQDRHKHTIGTVHVEAVRETEDDSTSNAYHNAPHL